MLLLVLVLVVAGCATVPGGEPTVRTPTMAVPSAAAMRVQVVEGANGARVRAGAGVLSPHEALERAAQDYAREIAARGELSHRSTRAGYETPMDRIERAGLRVRAVGENLAALSARAGMAKAVIDMWLESSGHRRNLLNNDYRLTGVGVAQGRDGLWYFVQLYAR